MTLVLTGTVISSLPTYSSSAFINVYGDNSNLLAGTGYLSDVFNTTLAFPVWGDDPTTPVDIDGLVNGESMSFQLIDGNNLYDLNLTFAGTNSFSLNSVLPAIGVTYAFNCSQDSPNQILGCTNEASLNYNTEANSDDGSCIAIVSGCTDLTAFNYNAEANTDDGSCIEIVLGCTIDWADNFNENANTNDGTCYKEGCASDWADNYDSLATQNTLPENECYRMGCNLNWAVNYDEYATVGDGSCFIQLNEEEYQSYIESSQEIVIDIQEGWNIFGYTSSQIVDIGDVMAPYNDKIYLIKDNYGSQYWPANNYNGIGDFIPGGGYQIKAYESFSISF